jgi:GR25 family glycosyltransferase involved in LPS biosynthesis
LKKKIPIIVITIKNSLREKNIVTRLNYLKLNYKLFYSIDGNNPKNYYFLKKKYNRTISENIRSKKMTYQEISIAYAHLEIYKYIVRNKIPAAVIMEDDCYPSKDLVNWVDCSYEEINNLDIISFYAISGYLEKKPHFVTANKFKIFKACTHIPNATCYQINLKACKYMLKKSKGKVFAVADWPVLFSKGELNLYCVIPLIAGLHHDHLSSATNKALWQNRNYLKSIKKFIIFYDILTAIYYVLHIPILIGKNVWGGSGLNLDLKYSFYREYYLDKKIFYIKNLLSKKFIRLEKYEYDKVFYARDLHENLELLIKKNKYK